MAVTLVVAASLARVLYQAYEVCAHDHLDVAVATAYNLDIMALELTLSSVAHISCEHQLDAHSLHIGGDTRLTAASLGRFETRGGDNLAVLDLEYGVVCAVTEVVVDVSIACRNCYFHILSYRD